MFPIDNKFSRGISDSHFPVERLTDLPSTELSPNKERFLSEEVKIPFPSGSLRMTPRCPPCNFSDFGAAYILA